MKIDYLKEISILKESILKWFKDKLSPLLQISAYMALKNSCHSISNVPAIKPKHNTTQHDQ